MAWFEQANGIIVGEYNVNQESLRLKELPDDDAAVIFFRNPVRTRDELRREAYSERGATIEKMIVALWEESRNGSTVEGDALESIRQKVKMDFP